MKLGAILGAFAVALALLAAGYWFFLRGDDAPAPADVAVEGQVPEDVDVFDEAADPAIPTFDIVRVERDG
ncbi:MAG: hypothetical protein CVT72_15535, partial [Alphaproteobacteria bacterium HGW-Alphaproteobacteria-11]